MKIVLEGKEKTQQNVYIKKDLSDESLYLLEDQTRNSLARITNASWLCGC